MGEKSFDSRKDHFVGNVDYLIEVLSVMGGETVSLIFSDSGSGCLARNPDEAESLSVVRPVVL